MEKTGKTYNIQFLQQSAGLDTEEGVNLCGSRRAYFDLLSTFGGKVRGFLVEFDEPKSPQEWILDLGNLHAELSNICDTTLSPKVEHLITLTKKHEKEMLLGDLRFGIYNGLVALCKKINEAEIKVDPGAHAHQADAPTPSPEAPGKEASPEPAALEAPQPAPQPQSPATKAPAQEQPPAPRMVVEARPQHFENLAAQIDKFEYDTAAAEIRLLRSFSYGDIIDGLLEHIENGLANYDFENVATDLKRLRQYASLKERTAGVTSGKRKILAVDDMPDMLNTIKGMLQDQFNVYCVTNHSAALKFLTANTPDLILLDIEMPEMSGFELAKIIQHMDSCKLVPILFLTGNVSVENVKTSVLAGGSDFIRKPPERDILVGKIRKHIADAH